MLLTMTVATESGVLWHPSTLYSNVTGLMAYVEVHPLWYLEEYFGFWSVNLLKCINYFCKLLLQFSPEIKITFRYEDYGSHGNVLIIHLLNTAF